MKKDAIIFCAAGIPIHTYDKEYDKDNHWRYTDKLERQYETAIYKYKDYNIESNSYDYLVDNVKGFKWQIAYKFLTEFDFSNYEYVAFFDDDVITDIQSINKAINIAKENDFKIFQLSTVDGSEHTHQILFQNRTLQWSTTNFVEGMGPFFHVSLIPSLLEFWKFHEVKSGYGFDLLYTEITSSKAAVIHEVSMFHPPKSFYGYVYKYYDNSEAEQEMAHILMNVYPKFMKEVYGKDTGPFNRQYIVYDYKLLNPESQIIYYRTS
jgi:hypothetical protein